MRNFDKLYIGGQWVAPHGQKTFEVVNPSTEAVSGKIVLGDETDLDRAVQAARQAFERYSQTSREERLAVLERVLAQYQQRADDLAEALAADIGCPLKFAKEAQVPFGMGHVHTVLEVLKSFQFEEKLRTHLVRKVPIGVCGLITPWNWPLAMFATKTAPALATGCTVVLKPSEFAPHSAQVFAEIIDAAKLPAGVFNMVWGDGPTVGAALSRHPGVDMVTITGSTRAGIEVAKNAAETVKRVHQELGGKSPFVVLPGADLQKAVASCVGFLMSNSGQSCSAPSRLLVHESQLQAACELAKATADSFTVGPPSSGALMGPVVNGSQWQRIQGYIRSGIEEGAQVVTGGAGRPDNLREGFFVKPTIFARTNENMKIVKEEIFGPVVVIQTYATEDEAARLANNTPYGLAAYVFAPTLDQARAFGGRLRAGQVYLNGSLDIFDLGAPFGGCKQSGNGRENGAFGFEAFLEEITLLGYEAAAA